MQLSPCGYCPWSTFASQLSKSKFRKHLPPSLRATITWEILSLLSRTTIKYYLFPKGNTISMVSGILAIQTPIKRQSRKIVVSASAHKICRNMKDSWRLNLPRTSKKEYVSNIKNSQNSTRQTTYNFNKIAKQTLHKKMQVGKNMENVQHHLLLEK